MLLAITLGIVLGVTGTALIHQWLAATLVEPRGAPLRAAEFPRLAPPRRPVARPSGRGTTTLGRRAA